MLLLDEIVSVCYHFSYSDRPIRVLVDAAKTACCLLLYLATSGVDFYALNGFAVE
jgi:L-cysteine/cystine lyase